MKPRWPRRTSALAAVLAVSAVVQMAAAKPPPRPFCAVNARQCHPLVGRTRAHFVGMLQQVIRAVPKVPGYRCSVEDKDIGEVGYGRNERRAAPERMTATVWCFGRGTDPRKRMPDVTINVELSMLPAVVAEGGAREKEHDPLVWTGPKRVDLVFGKLREWRDPQEVVHRGYDPSNAIGHPKQEVVDNGPYLVSAQLGIDAESPAALGAFAGGVDRAAIRALMAREEERRKADREVGSIAGALP